MGPNANVNFGLDRSTALVTGAGRGLGAHIAASLAASGARVYVMSRNAIELNALVDRIVENGGRAEALVCDVTDPSHFDKMLEQIDHLNILVNNAGTNYPEPFLEVSATHLDAMLSLNVRAMFTTAQSCARKMVAAGNQGGSIINMSSQMGHVGAVSRTVYCMTKHAVEGLTKAMAIELAPYSIRVNTVAPTFVETPLTTSFLQDPKFREWVMDRLPMGRLLPAEDVASAVCYLASNMAAMITGTSLRIDGGWTAQ